MAGVTWSKAALLNLKDIGAYIADSNPAAAGRLLRRLLHLGNSLNNSPTRGRLAGKRERELVTVRPYIIRYEVADDVVLILSVRHSSRGPLKQ